MSFSSKAKSELTRIEPETYMQRVCELSGLMKMSGTIKLKGFRKLDFIISTENPAIARKIFKLLKLTFSITTEILVKKNNNLKKNNSYMIVITNAMGSNKILKEVGILKEEDGSFYIEKGIKKEIMDEDISEGQLKRAFLRGAFLGGGSISDPEKNYHMEFVSTSEDFSNDIMKLINSYGYNSKIVSRKNNYVVYLKESEQISDVLNLMGAHNALLNLENIKIVKEMRNNVNRIVNCETANLSKTVNASIKQIENIKLIKNKIGLSNLPENLKEVAILRLENENMSLKELGQLLNPPIGKSGVNHRFRKIEKIAEDIIEKESKNDK